MKSSESLVALALALGAYSAAHAERLQLEGRFEYRTDAESLGVIGKQVCFFPDAQFKHWPA